MNQILSLTTYHLLSREKILLGFLIVPVVVGSLNIAMALGPTATPLAPTASEARLIELTNGERRKQGLPELEFNQALYQAAEAKAADMLERDYFDHTSPAGKTPWAFINEAGYDYHKAGENLAIDFQTLEGPVPAWMASPTHRANILKSEYDEVAIARVAGEFQGRQTTIVVQMFGAKPFSASRIGRQIIGRIASPLPL